MLGWRIQEIAEQIQAKSKTDDDNNEVNLLLWRSSNSQVGKNLFLSRCIFACTIRIHLQAGLLVECGVIALKLIM